MTVSLHELSLTDDSSADWFRNIVSLRQSRHLFDSLCDTAWERELLVRFEGQIKPFTAQVPLIYRPYEFAERVNQWVNAIHYPYDHPAESRFSRGEFGVWYGADTLQTSIYETAHHFRQSLLDLQNMHFDGTIVRHRRVHQVSLQATLLDLRPVLVDQPRVYDHPSDYSAPQALGAEAHRQGFPGFLTCSARVPVPGRGEIVAVMKPDLLHNPRNHCYLTYHYDPRRDRIDVKRTPDTVDMAISY